MKHPGLFTGPCAPTAPGDAARAGASTTGFSREALEPPMRTAISPAPDPFPAQPKAHTSGVIKIIFVERTNLLAFVDGEADLFLAARNLVEQSKFAERLGVQGDVPVERKEFSINTCRRPDRRNPQ